MKRSFASLLLASAAVAACSSGCDGGGSAGTTGADPVTVACQSARLCDSIVMPAHCTLDAIGSIDCGTGGGTTTGTTGAGGAGGGAGGSGGAGGAFSPKNEAAIACTFEGLRDRKVGAFNIIDPVKGTVPCGVRTEIVSFGDGTVSVLRADYCAGDVNVELAVRSALQPPSFFTDCLAATTDAARIACLGKLTTGKTATGGVCACRGIHDDPKRGQCHSTQ